MQKWLKRSLGRVGKKIDAKVDSGWPNSNSLHNTLHKLRCMLNAYVGEDVLAPNRNLNTGGRDKYIYKCN